jgi:hypothetical protein
MRWLNPNFSDLTSHLSCVVKVCYASPCFFLEKNNRACILVKFCQVCGFVL